MRKQSRVKSRESRAGYTLVEMLVAVALVVLMMSMFAEVFSIATGSISTQRGIAENDQAARTFTTTMKMDLDKRTFRSVVPFFDGEVSGNVPFSFAERQGYFYISENDPENTTDDILQFTVRSTVTYDNPDLTPYFGAAIQMLPTSAFLSNANQPEADDGEVLPDRTADSTAAEISYFLRNGMLYRRVLLIREPLPVAGSTSDPMTTNNPTLFFQTPLGPGANFFKIPPFDPGTDGQPGVSGVDDDMDGATDNNNELGWPGTDDGTNTDDFWRYFDLSAHFTPTGASLNGIEKLDNTLPPLQRPLGLPLIRFGHNHANGLPREFVNGGADFIGRFLHEETSHPDFNYPQAPSVVGNPMSAPLTLNSSGAVSAFADGPRKGEDIVLMNVHEFDIQVWEDIGQDSELANDGGEQWVDIGHALPNGDFTGVLPVGGSSPTDSQNFNMASAPPLGFAPDPDPPTGADRHLRFDTWHPGAIVGSVPHAPYRRMLYHPPDSYSAQTPATILKTHSVDLPIFEDNPAFPAFSVGDLVFAPNDPTTMSPSDASYAFFWRCELSEARDINLNPLPATPGEALPLTAATAFPRADLGAVRHGLTTLTHFEPDANANGILDPTEDINNNNQQDRVRWRAFYNWRPLKAIRIRIRFLHVATAQMRQVTFVYSLQ